MRTSPICRGLLGGSGKPTPPLFAQSFKSKQRFYSSSIATAKDQSDGSSLNSVNDTGPKLPPLSVMPLSTLLRSYLMTSILSSPRILKLTLPLMNRIANSQVPFLNPDRNPLLHFFVRRLFYDHFAAGENSKEVKRNIKRMKETGYKGVILGYAKEVNVTGGASLFDAPDSSKSDRSIATIMAWKECTLNTLRMIGESDILAIKYSGAGPSTLKALSKKGSPPPEMWEAMLEICEAVKKRKTRIWIDAEQQDLQGTIDQWTIDLMRKYNRGDSAMVYTTMQAYLKRTGDNVLRHLKQAQAEGWILAIKLVRGAYIATEQRDLIHDTIEDTHRAYNTIANNLLRQSYPGLSSDKPYPRTALFLATHNDESIKKAYATQCSRITANTSTIPLSYAQLQGMADEASCGLLQLCHTVDPNKPDPNTLALAPHAFKCLTYGSTQECLQYLLRRAKENEDALGRTRYWAAGFRREISRRARRSFGLRSRG